MQGLDEDGGIIRLVLEAPADRVKALVPLKAAVDKAVRAIDGVKGTQTSPPPSARLPPLRALLPPLPQPRRVVQHPNGAPRPTPSCPGQRVT